MNWVDFIILLIVLLFAIEGIKGNFVSQLLNIIGLIFALISALTLYRFASDAFVSLFNLPIIAANPIGFLIVWVISETFFFSIMTFSSFKKMFANLSSNKFSRYFGFAPAVLNGFLFMAFVLLFVVSMPIRPDIKQAIFDSKVGSVLVSQVTALEKPLNTVFGPITKQGLTFLTIKPEDKGAIDLQFTQDIIFVDKDAEQQMFNLVNRERAINGAKLLIWDESLAIIGRAHSEDMFNRGYFSHFSPEGADVGDRLLLNKINFSYAGENLALAPNVQRAHTGLMNSEGHRRNILDPAFGKMGIGVIDGGVYGKMFTQVFTE